MRKATALLALVLLALLVSGSLRAEETKRNNIGFRLICSSPADSAQWKSGTGYGVYGLYNLNPKSSSPTKPYLKVSLDFVDYDSDDDLLMEGLLETQSLSLSILWVREEPEGGRVYYGFGLSSLTNDFEITDAAFNELWNTEKAYYWNTYGETLEYLEYEEWVDNALGYHIMGGAEIKLSEDWDFQVEVGYSFIPADVGFDYYAETDSLIFTDSDEDEVKIGGLNLSVGLSLRF